MNATCRPFSIATSAASSATMVLPAPTSPCSSRFIGVARCMSSTISFSAVRCPSVSLNGRMLRADSRMRSSTWIDARLRLADRRALAQHQPELEQEELLEDEPDLRRRSECVQLIGRRVRGGEMRANQRRAPVRQIQTLADVFWKRIGHGVRQVRQHIEHEAPLHLRRHRAGLFVHRHDAAGVDRLRGLFGFGAITVAADDFVVRIHHLQRRPRLDRAEEHHVHVAPEDVLQERLVHPERDDRSGGVADERFEDLESRTTGCAQAAALDAPGNRHLLARLQ